MGAAAKITMRLGQSDPNAYEVTDSNSLERDEKRFRFSSSPLGRMASGRFARRHPLRLYSSRRPN